MTINPAVRLRRLMMSLRASLWVIPTLAVIASILLAGALTRVSIPEASQLSQLLFPGGAEGARGMLQAIAGSVITVTSLVFSITVVTLQLASSQFSPRLLRTFLSDRGNQIVLAVFLATFSYSITVLRTIQAGDNGGQPFVPEVAVTGAFLLVMGSVAALVYFIHHITQEIQVDTMMRDVERDTRRTIEAEYPDEGGDFAADSRAPEVPERAACLVSKHSGFIQDVDVSGLAGAAQASDVIIRIHAGIGEAVAEAAPLAWIWCRNGERPSSDVVEELRGPLEEALDMGHERTLQRDVALGLRQLVDVAVKAMSPSVNDPTTAVHAISHLTPLMCVLGGRRLGDLVGRDDEGVLRCGVRRPDFADYVDLACGQLRRFGAGEVHVVKALLWLLREVAGTASPQRHDAVRREARLIVAAAERELADSHDLEDVKVSAAAVERALDGDLRP